MKNSLRTPSRLQSHPAECGAVCVGIILEFHHIYLSNIELRRLCHVSRDCASIGQLRDCLDELGHEGKVFKRGIKTLKGITSPVIIHWDMNHFVVLEGLNDEYAYINDPALGRRKLSLIQFARHYTGICLSITINPQSQRKQSVKQKSSQRLWELLPKQIHRARLFFGLTCFSGLVVFFIELFYTGLSYGFFDYVVEREMFVWGYVLILIGVGLCAIRMIAEWLHRSQLSRSTLNIAARVKAHFFEQLLNKPLNFLEAHYSGELYQRSLEAERFIHFWFQMIAKVGEHLFILLISSMLLFMISPLLGLVHSIPFVILTFVTLALRPGLEECHIREAQENGRFHTLVIQRMQVFVRFFVMGAQQHLLTTCLPALTRWQAAKTQTQRHLLTQETLTTFFQMVLPCVTIFFGTYLLTSAQLSYGEFLFASFIAVIFSTQLQAVSQSIHDYVGLAATRDRVVEVLEQVSDHQVAKKAKQQTELAKHSVRVLGNPKSPTSSTLITPVIEVRNLDFGYNARDPDLFNQFSLSLKQGEILCLVGASGSGKTTLLEVISGLRPAISGQRLYSGTDWIGPLPCGLVFADDDFVEGSLSQFLAGGAALEVTKSVEILKEVELFDRLGFYIQGDHQERLEGEGLSGGEIQRLMLAQALYHSEDCVFFDEAFSHLSLEQSKRIVNRLRNRGTAMVMASQRPEIQSLSDRCVYLEENLAPIELTDMQAGCL